VSPERVAAEIDGRRINLSNLDKVLYPETGFTKGQMLNYYAEISSVMLPYLRDRPLTMKRFPDGVQGQAFFEKHAPSHTPDWVGTVAVPSSRGTHEPIDYVVIGDRAALMWAANLATIEFHVPLWRVSETSDPGRSPDQMVFDLDPGPGTSIVECCEVARWIRTQLDDDPVYSKTSGSKGLQLYVPLSGIDSGEARERAHSIAMSVERDHPELAVSNMRKDLRKGKVLIDWSQNHPAKTTVCVYSLRARPEPTVSTPVDWKEVDTCAKKRDPDLLRFEAPEVLDRVGRLGDLTAGLLSERPGA